MGKPLRVLMVEDSEDDVLLAMHALKHGGYDPVYERVETSDDMKVALHRETWDVVLSDYMMPRFTGLAAIKVLQESGRDVPFILISGNIGEETAVEALKAGAHDCVMRNNLLRLALVVERALEEATARAMGRQAAQHQKLYCQFLDVLNNPTELSKLMKDIITLIRETTGIEAVAIRLQQGEDFPYYEASGFPLQYLKAAKSICLRDAGGEIIRDADGKPLLNCLCGKVLSGRTDPSSPYFTAGGSFWSNSISEFLASLSDEDRHSEEMKHCQAAGYESVALMPLKSGNEMIGLLQLNYKRPDRFSPASIQFFENIGASIGNAVHRQQTMDALRDGEKKYRELVDFLPITIIETDGDGRITTINHTALALFGLTRDDLDRGMSIRQIFPPQYLEKIKDNFLKLKAENARMEGEYTLAKKDGSEFPTLLFSAPILQEGSVKGFRCAVIDLTEIKRAQDACTISEDKFRRMYEHALEGIYQITPAGRFLSANPALIRMLGFETSEELMAGITDVARQLYVHPEQRQILVNMFKQDGVVAGFEFEAYRRDGTVMWLSINAHAVKNKDGEIIYHEGTMEDITKRKEMEEQLRQAYLVLHETNDRLIEEDKLAALGTLAAGVAHEILNPANIVTSGISMLESTQALSKPVKEMLAVFQRQIDRIVRITRDLHQFSQRSTGKMELTDVPELIRETLSLCEPRLKVEHVMLEVDGEDDIPKVVMDRNRIEHVFLNIINNAMDAMEGKEKKVLRISTKGIAEPGISASRVLTAISDLGDGIRDGDLNSIFDPFFTTKEVGKGTGLGLSTSYNIVQNHGGRIWAANNSSGGATFFVELPAMQGQDQPIA